MADKLTPLILDALTRAVAEPTGLPLFATKAEAGLFANTSIGKPAAQKCLAQGLLQMLGTDISGKATRERYGATEAGLRHLVEHESPKRVLEDFVRVLEARQDDVQQLLADTRRMAESLHGLHRAAVQLLPKVSVCRVRVPDEARLRNGNATDHGGPAVAMAEPLSSRELGDCMLMRLRDWSSSGEAIRDCPLPELYRSLGPLDSTLSIGQFHDALRQLHDDERIYLHPWTGPLYTLPEPTLALLSGHEIAYYASLR